MFKVNEDYLKLPGSYLFSTIGKKVAAYQEANPEKSIIRLGIGDVTQPLAPAIIDALHGAVDEMAHAETFHGYAPDLGYEFLRSAMAKNDYQDRGVILKRMRYLYPTAQSVTPEISRRFLQRTIRSLCATRYIRYTWTPTSWQAAQAPMIRLQRHGAM